MISESCHSGNLLTEGDVSEARNRVISRRFRPSIIQIGACYSHEWAYVANGVPVFTASLVDVWAKGAFQGGHEQFADAIREKMSRRFNAADGRRMSQEPRYLATGPTARAVKVFNELTPIWIAGRRGLTVRP